MEKTFLCGYGKKKIDLEIFLVWHNPDHMHKKDGENCLNSNIVRFPNFRHY